MNQLLYQIISTSTKIQTYIKQNNDHPNFTALKELVHFCEKYLFETKNDFERVVCFFLSSYLNNFFYNFGCDTPFDVELQSVKKSFYFNIANLLKELETAVKNEDINKIFDCFSTVISDYVRKVNLLNQGY